MLRLESTADRVERQADQRIAMYNGGAEGAFDCDTPRQICLQKWRMGSASRGAANILSDSAPVVLITVTTM